MCFYIHPSVGSRATLLLFPYQERLALYPLDTIQTFFARVVVFCPNCLLIRTRQFTQDEKTRYAALSLSQKAKKQRRHKPTNQQMDTPAFRVISLQLKTKTAILPNHIFSMSDFYPKTHFCQLSFFYQILFFFFHEIFFLHFFAFL